MSYIIKRYKPKNNYDRIKTFINIEYTSLLNSPFLLDELNEYQYNIKYEDFTTIAKYSLLREKIYSKYNIHDKTQINNIILLIKDYHTQINKTYIKYPKLLQQYNNISLSNIINGYQFIIKNNKVVSVENPNYIKLLIPITIDILNRKNKTLIPNKIFLGGTGAPTINNYNIFKYTIINKIKTEIMGMPNFKNMQSPTNEDFKNIKIDFYKNYFNDIQDIINTNPDFFDDLIPVLKAKNIENENAINIYFHSFIKKISSLIQMKNKLYINKKNNQSLQEYLDNTDNIDMAILEAYIHGYNVFTETNDVFEPTSNFIQFILDQCLNLQYPNTTTQDYNITFFNYNNNQISINPASSKKDNYRNILKLDKIIEYERDKDTINFYETSALEQCKQMYKILEDFTFKNEQYLNQIIPVCNNIILKDNKTTHSELNTNKKIKYNNLILYTKHQNIIKQYQSLPNFNTKTYTIEDKNIDDSFSLNKTTNFNNITDIFLFNQNYNVKKIIDLLNLFIEFIPKLNVISDCLNIKLSDTAPEVSLNKFNFDITTYMFALNNVLLILIHLINTSDINTLYNIYSSHKNEISKINLSIPIKKKKLYTNYLKIIKSNAKQLLKSLQKIPFKYINTSLPVYDKFIEYNDDFQKFQNVYIANNDTEKQFFKDNSYILAVIYSILYDSTLQEYINQVINNIHINIPAYNIFTFDNKTKNISQPLKADVINQLIESKTLMVNNIFSFMAVFFVNENFIKNIQSSFSIDYDIYHLLKNKQPIVFSIPKSQKIIVVDCQKNNSLDSYFNNTFENNTNQDSFEYNKKTYCFDINNHLIIKKTQTNMPKYEYINSNSTNPDNPTDYDNIKDLHINFVNPIPDNAQPPANFDKQSILIMQKIYNLPDTMPIFIQRFDNKFINPRYSRVEFKLYYNMALYGGVNSNLSIYYLSSFIYYDKNTATYNNCIYTDYKWINIDNSQYNDNNCSKIDIIDNIENFITSKKVYEYIFVLFYKKANLSDEKLCKDFNITNDYVLYREKDKPEILLQKPIIEFNKLLNNKSKSQYYQQFNIHNVFIPIPLKSNLNDNYVNNYLEYLKNIYLILLNNQSFNTINEIDINKFAQDIIKNKFSIRKLIDDEKNENQKYCPDNGFNLLHELYYDPKDVQFGDDKRKEINDFLEILLNFKKYLCERMPKIKTDLEVINDNELLDKQFTSYINNTCNNLFYTDNNLQITFKDINGYNPLNNALCALLHIKSINIYFNTHRWVKHIYKTLNYSPNNLIVNIMKLIFNATHNINILNDTSIADTLYNYANYNVGNLKSYNKNNCQLITDYKNVINSMNYDIISHKFIKNDISCKKLFFNLLLIMNYELQDKLFNNLIMNTTIDKIINNELSIFTINKTLLLHPNYHHIKIMERMCAELNDIIQVETYINNIINIPDIMIITFENDINEIIKGRLYINDTINIRNNKYKFACAVSYNKYENHYETYYIDEYKRIILYDDSCGLKIVSWEYMNCALYDNIDFIIYERQFDFNKL